MVSLVTIISVLPKPKVEPNSAKRADPALRNASPQPSRGRRSRGDDETIVLDPQLNRVTQSALFDEGLRNADATGITEPH